MPKPNLVVVVMDCVRAWDFPGGFEAVDGLPFVGELRRESVTFPRAASPAPWTMPSHASLFTGLYPWEHGMHGRRSLALSPSVPRLPDLLRASGFRSACLSANPLVSPTTGLAAGFDVSAWGSLFEMFLRLDHRTTPPKSVPSQRSPVATKEGWRASLLRRLPYDELPLRTILERNVWMPTVAGKALEGLRDCPGHDAFDVARWIEPTFSDWVASISADRPVFTFINLLDAHEPYFTDPSARDATVGWGRYARLRQDRLGWLEHERRRTRRDADLLHGLYRESIRRLDRRVRGIVDVLRQSGRWEDTLFVLTSDHGQAFGENGMMYHRFRVDDAQIRIPMIVHLPGGEHGGATGRGWASLIDIVPTVFRALDTESPVRVSGWPLQDLVDDERRDPLFAISDGTIGERWIPESRRPELDRTAAAVYRGALKVVLEQSPREVHAYNVEQDPREARDLAAARTPEMIDLEAEGDAVIRYLEERPKEAPSEEVSERLKAWGYI